ncbi:3-hexulose-6-phosphate synthase [Nanoarchaeota archaeon]
MKLQLALDVVDLKKALSIANKTKKYIDIIELGTPLIKQNGLGAIKKFKKFRKPIFADLKTMDTGAFEASLAFKAGASSVSVCAAAANETVKGLIKEAKKRKKQSVVDLIGVKDAVKRTKQVLKHKPTYIGIHTGIDQQLKGCSVFENLEKISKLTKNICVAGGINAKTVNKVLKYKPKIIVIGGAITKSKNPGKTAKEIKELIK